MLITAFFLIFIIIAVLPLTLEKLFTATDLADMGIRLENSCRN